ncbi:MAG: hypothetical protein H0W62_15270 [Chitinophagales bacterium]|nr:hypothetical protein [Chitinophagales bacterium]
MILQRTRYLFSAASSAIAQRRSRSEAAAGRVALTADGYQLTIKMEI